jgi:hypothetical protein
LLGEFPEIDCFDQSEKYKHSELDFGRRLIAKFRFSPKALWHSENFTPAPEEALYPKEHRDRLLAAAQQLKASLTLTDK